MTMRELLFSFEGRISRRTYWISVVSTALVAAISFVVSATLIRLGLFREFRQIIFNYVLGGVDVVALFLIMIVTIKRLHDRDRSWTTLAAVVAVGYAVIWLERLTNHWLLGDRIIEWNRPFELAMLTTAAPAAVLTHTLALFASIPVFGNIPKLVNALPNGFLSYQVVYYSIDILLGFFAVVVGLWYFWEVALRRGTLGPNRYGPDPVL